MHRLLVGILIVASMSLNAPIAHAAEQLDGTVKLTTTSFAAGVGVSWGSGVLTFKGKEYPFRISGISAGAIGFSSAQLSGEVFDLRNVEDFNGNYASLSAGLTIAGGGEAFAMRNQNGVVLNLVATTQGLNFKLGVDGIKIELTKP